MNTSSTWGQGKIASTMERAVATTARKGHGNNLVRRICAECNANRKNEPTIDNMLHLVRSSVTQTKNTADRCHHRGVQWYEATVFDGHVFEHG